jgi:nucleoid DNA-binding protein
LKHSEFLKALANDLETSRKEARRILEAFLRSAYFGLIRDGHLEIKEFGILRVIETPEREMTSGITGEDMKFKKSKRTTFRMAAKLRRALKGEA